MLSENTGETTGSTGFPLLVPEEVGQTHPLGMLLLLPVPREPRAGRCMCLGDGGVSIWRVPLLGASEQGSLW